MARKKAEVKEKKKHRFLRWLLVGTGLAVTGYVIARKQRPDVCVPAGGPEERVLVKDPEELSGLGQIMQGLITELLKNPAKIQLLNTMNFVLSIEPVEQPETAITMTFSDGYLVIEPGVVPAPDIKLVCDYEALMQMASMGAGLAAVKFLSSPEGQKLAQKFMSRQCRLEGAASHPVAMMKFSKFLSPA
ncbi:MAG TPA: hypothetical protein VIK02_02065 [Candidatus Anoxymicrobiaceae bacterium]|jgi:hypothetical protein